MCSNSEQSPEGALANSPGILLGELGRDRRAPVRLRVLLELLPA